MRVEIYVRSEITIRRIKPYRHSRTKAKIESPVKIIQRSKGSLSGMSSRDGVSRSVLNTLILLRSLNEGLVVSGWRTSAPRVKQRPEKPSKQSLPLIGNFAEKSLADLPIGQRSHVFGKLRR